MDNDQIFFSDAPNSQNYENSIQDDEILHCDLYLSKGDSLKYVDQFLSHTSNKLCQKTQQKLPQNDNKQNELDIIPSQGNVSRSDIHLQLSQNIANPTSHSVFHNFQKHLTIFLRSVLKPDQIRENGQQYVIARDLWRIFCKSTINAKRMVHSILGEIDPKGKQKELKQLGLKEIYAKLPIDKINKGKQILRELIKNSVSKTNLQEYLNRTRIKNKEYFQLYLKEFIQELHQGVFKRRIRRDRVLKSIN